MKRLSEKVLRIVVWFKYASSENEIPEDILPSGMCSGCYYPVNQAAYFRVMLRGLMAD
jgi:hypothetical protein